MKEKHKRVTFTIENEISNIINYYSEYYDISKSKFISDCIEYSYQFMEKELEEKIIVSMIHYMKEVKSSPIPNL